MTLSGPPSNMIDPDPIEPDPKEARDPGQPERLGTGGLDKTEDRPKEEVKSEGPLTRLTAPGGDAGTRIAALASRLEGLDAELAAQGNRLRDAERSLVDRIADVDDDRRRTWVQLQRAVQAQSDDLAGRLRRLGVLTGAGLLLIAVLSAAGILLSHYLGQRSISALQGDLTAELQSLGLELDRLKGASAEQGRGEARIAALTETLDRVSAELAATKAAAVAQREAQTAAEPGGVALLDERIARLRTDQQGLIADIGALRETLAMVTSRPPEPSGEDVLGERMAHLEAEQRALLTEVGTLRESVATVTSRPSEPSGGDVLTKRMARLEADQQALLTEIGTLREARAAAPPASAMDSGAAKTPATERPPGPHAEPSPNSEIRGKDDRGEPAAGAEPVPTSTGSAPALVTQASAAEQPFMLQLMGSHDRGAVLAMATHAHLPESVFIRQETLRGRPWFVLIHSLHPTYEDAKAERDRLPSDLARLKTWIRRLPADAVVEPIASGRTP